jgi:hypothetical protein
MATARYEVSIWSGNFHQGPLSRLAFETYNDARDYARKERARLIGAQFVSVFDAIGGVVMLKWGRE